MTPRTLTFYRKEGRAMEGRKGKEHGREGDCCICHLGSPHKHNRQTLHMAAPPPPPKQRNTHSNAWVVSEDYLVS